MCHGECTWLEDSCQENKPLPVYKGSAVENDENYDDDCLGRLSNVPHGDGGESGDGNGQMSVGGRAAAP